MILWRLKAVVGVQTYSHSHMIIKKIEIGQAVVVLATSQHCVALHCRDEQ